MTHEVFISHSSKDKAIADAVCAALESAKIRCWIAPRDILAGLSWASAIEPAITKSRIMVLIFSSYSNNSKYTKREVNLAFDSDVIIIPFRIANIELTGDMKFFLMGTHWLDAIDPPTEKHIQSLVEIVKQFIKGSTSISTPDVTTRVETVGLEPKTYTNSIGMKFVLIPAGEFMMGSEEYDWEKPVHRVKISKPFYLGLYPVTQKEWKSVMGGNKHSSYLFSWDDIPGKDNERLIECLKKRLDINWDNWVETGNIRKIDDGRSIEIYMKMKRIFIRRNDENPRVSLIYDNVLSDEFIARTENGNLIIYPISFIGDNLPVEYVSWNDVQEFITKLNEKESSNKYRLPSAAEWEYAARAGTTTRYSFGDDDSKLGDYAWYSVNSGGEPHNVGQKKPNPWGLYDMHGNVMNWVQDKGHKNYVGAPTDGSSWESGDGSTRVIRSGSWIFENPNDCKSAKSSDLPPYRFKSYIGFRLLRIL